MAATTRSEMICWRAWPAKQRPAAAAMAGGIIVALAGTAYMSFGIEWAIGTIVIMMLGLNRFFLPSSFEMDAEGVTAKHPLRSQRLQWADVKRFAHDERGGYLSTRAVASRMDAYGGMHLIFAGNSDEIAEMIHRHLAGGRP